jgi:hypothetical protein
MSEINKGDRIADNDPRMVGRVLLVISQGRPGYVHAADTQHRSFRIQTKRIYTDGKPRRSGFTLLPA